MIKTLTASLKLQLGYSETALSLKVLVATIDALGHFETG